jgi:hypothetical protein
MMSKDLEVHWRKNPYTGEMYRIWKVKETDNETEKGDEGGGRKESPDNPHKSRRRDKE